MYRSIERTALCTMAAEVVATYGGYFQPLRCWSEVYTDYLRREILERDLATQYLADLEILRIQPMSTDIELIAWTRSDLNVDILVGCTDRKFYLLHNVQAFYCNGTMRVVGIAGVRFKSPFLQVSGPHAPMTLFPPEQIEFLIDRGSGETHENKVTQTLQLDYQLTRMCRRKAAANIVQPIQSVIGCPTFLAEHLLNHPLVHNGFSLAELARTVQRTAKTTFPLAFTSMTDLQQKAIKVTACQQFLVRFEKFLRTAAHLLSAVFVRNISPVPERVNNNLRNITFRPLRLQESRFWQPTTQGDYERRTAPKAYDNITWGPTMSLYDIERHYPGEKGPWRR